MKRLPALAMLAALPALAADAPAPEPESYVIMTRPQFEILAVTLMAQRDEIDRLRAALKKKTCDTEA